MVDDQYILFHTMRGLEKKVSCLLNICPADLLEQNGRRLSWQLLSPMCLQLVMWVESLFSMLLLPSASISATLCHLVGVTQTVIYEEAGPFMILPKLGFSRLYLYMCIFLSS